MLARIAPAGLVVSRRLDTCVEPSRVDPGQVRARTSAAWLQAGSALWALTTIASAPSGECLRGECGVEAEVRRPGRIDHERRVVLVGCLGETLDVTDGPDVGRVADEHGPHVGVLVQRATAYRVRRDARKADRSRGRPRAAPTPG